VVTLTINAKERTLTLRGDYREEISTWKIADMDCGEGAGETLREGLERVAGKKTSSSECSLN
jgi:hypothetical protein